MENLTIEKISQPQAVTTQYGQKTKYGVKFKEYNKWASGFETAMLKTWQQGDTVQAEVWENNGYLNFKPMGYGSGGQQSQSQSTQKQEEEKPNWDKISWSKCKHAYLLEAFKLGYNLADIEKTCESWADASMRKLGEPRIFDKGQGEEADQIPFNDNDIPPEENNEVTPNF